jgi:hypothetical protein
MKAFIAAGAISAAASALLIREQPEHHRYPRVKMARSFELMDPYFPSEYARQSTYDELSQHFREQERNVNDFERALNFEKSQLNAIVKQLPKEPVEVEQII